MPQDCIVCHARGIPCRIKDMAMLRCPACGFLWLKEKLLSDDHYSHVDIGLDAGKAERRRRNVSERMNILTRRLPSLNHACDVGTGEGMFLQILAENGYTGCWGLEPGAQGAAHAKALGLDVVQGTIDDLPSLTRERITNTLTLFHVIEHLDDPKKDLKSIYDALPSGGTLVIETPNLRGFSPRALGDAWELFYPEHLWYFDDRTLPAFLTGAGFTVIARGRRDFDIGGKGIAELLFRLGLRKPTKTESKYTSPAEKSVPSIPKSPLRPSVLKSLVQKILVQLVRLSGRVDYVWVIARKA